MKQPVAFQNSPNVIFAGSLAYLSAIAIWSLSLLLFCLGYPQWITSGSLFLASLASAILSHHYLSRSFGSLHIGQQGMEYFSVAGEKSNFRWKELAHITVLPGWLRIYDKQGKKVFSYTYGLGKQHSLIKVIERQMGKRKIRPVIWPEVTSTPASARKKTVRKCKTGGSAAIQHASQRKKEGTTTLKVARKRQPSRLTAKNKRPVRRKRSTAIPPLHDNRNSLMPQS